MPTQVLSDAQAFQLPLFATQGSTMQVLVCQTHDALVLSILEPMHVEEDVNPVQSVISFKGGSDFFSF